MNDDTKGPEPMTRKEWYRYEQDMLLKAHERYLNTYEKTALKEYLEAHIHLDYEFQERKRAGLIKEDPAP